MPLRKADYEAGIDKRFTDYSKHGTPYMVIKWKTGQWTCPCSDWVNRRAKLEDHTDRAPATNHCKHVLRAIRGELTGSRNMFPVRARPAGTVYLAPSTPKQAPRGRAISLSGEEV